MSSGIAPAILLGVSFLVTVAWVVVLVIPHSWQIKNTMIWNFDLGLYNVEVTKSLGGHGLGLLAKGVDKATGGDTASSIINKLMEHEGTIQGFRDQFCNLAMVIPANCNPWNQLLIGSWVMLFGVIITVILLLTASGLYFVYQSQTVPRWRQWSLGLFSLAPVVAIGSLGAYACLSFSFGSWLAEFAVPGQTGIGHTISFGPVCIFACLVGLLTAVPALLLCLCGQKTEEKLNEEDGYYPMEGQNIYAQPGYGGTAYQDPQYAGAAPPQYGQYQQQGPGY